MQQNRKQVGCVAALLGLLYAKWGGRAPEFLWRSLMKSPSRDAEIIQPRLCPHVNGYLFWNSLFYVFHTLIHMQSNWSSRTEHDFYALQSAAEKHGTYNWMCLDDSTLPLYRKRKTAGGIFFLLPFFLLYIQLLNSKQTQFNCQPSDVLLLFFSDWPRTCHYYRLNMWLHVDNIISQICQR